MTLKMMDETVHYCTRCKLDLNHRITLMDGEKPKTVLCLTCKSERSYKAPKVAKAPKARKHNTLSVRAPAKLGRAARELAEKTQNEKWLKKLTTSQKTPKPYQFDGLYSVDDIVNHEVFGNGLVTSLMSPDKIEVFFGESVKLLKTGKY